MRFEERVECGADDSELWARASDLGRFTEYWHGTRRLEYSAAGQSSYQAKIEFAFGGRGAAKIDVDHQAKTVTISFLEGPFRGTQKIWVEGGAVWASWDVEFSGIYRLLAGWSQKHFRQGTINALKRLCAGGDHKPEEHPAEKTEEAHLNPQP